LPGWAKAAQSKLKIRRGVLGGGGPGASEVPLTLYLGRRESGLKIGIADGTIQVKAWSNLSEPINTIWNTDIGKDKN